MFKDQLLNASEVVGPHAPVPGQADGWREPELALTVRSSNMNVRGFLSLVRVEMEPE